MFHPVFKSLLLVLALSFSAPAVGQPHAGSRYYLVMSATEGGPHVRFGIRPRILRAFLDAASRSHTFATFLKVTDGKIDAEVTLSWMPARGHFGPGYTMPQRGIHPGSNYDLDETFQVSRGKTLRAWGPYEITETFFRRADRRAEFLGKRRTGYKMMLPVREELRLPALHGQAGGAINCIMGVSQVLADIDTDKEYGIPATALVLGAFASIGNTFVSYGPQGLRPDILELMRYRERAGRHGLVVQQ